MSEAGDNPSTPCWVSLQEAVDWVMSRGQPPEPPPLDETDLPKHEMHAFQHIVRYQHEKMATFQHTVQRQEAAKGYLLTKLQDGKLAYLHDPQQPPGNPGFWQRFESLDEGIRSWKSVPSGDPNWRITRDRVERRSFLVDKAQLLPVHEQPTLSREEAVRRAKAFSDEHPEMGGTRLYNNLPPEVRAHVSQVRAREMAPKQKGGRPSKSNGPS